MTKSSPARVERRNGEEAKPDTLSLELRGPVAIGVPSGDFVDSDFAMCLATMMAQYKIPTVLVNAKGCYVHKGRNHCVKVAQSKGCGHLLFLDSDMMFPPLTLVRLLSHKKDIVGCMYSRRVAPFTNLGTPKDRTVTKVTAETALVEMDMLPTGVMLIDMRVFDKLERPYFNFGKSVTSDPDDEIGEDVYFCQKARESGFQLWADIALSMQIGHVGTAVYRVHDDQKEAALAVGLSQSRIDGVQQAAE